MQNIPGYSRFDKIYEGSASVIYRAVSIRSGEPVIVKAAREEQPPLALIKRYRQEYEITKSIESEGVLKVHALENLSNSLFLIFENFEGESLKSILERRRFGIEEFLLVGVKLTQTLHEIHHAGIIHRDLNPSNIIYNPQTGRAKIIDFGLSIKGDSFIIPNVLEGTISYISPEQTGRMNKRVDWRTDFYSLGVTFYEMLTGRCPFETKDPLELIHSHIARKPAAPHEFNPQIPEMLSSIIMKLLSKNVEDRYQSALGIMTDLETCSEQFKNTKNIEPFSLGLKDILDSFVLPSKLYGREAETAKLLSMLHGVSSGRKEMVLVSGAPGIGKTALIKELFVAQKTGWFISSKFDQFVRNIPYSAIIGAFRELIRQILAESDEKLSGWRESIQSALSPNCQVMINLIPELELITGPQPPIPVLGAKENQNRFKIVFYDFVALFCKKEHPLIIFLDDMQWADLPSLGLIEIMMSLEGGAFMLICAYRDNEVSSSHPFMEAVEHIPDEFINRLHLNPLESTCIADLISDIVRRNRSEVEDLALLVQKKTGGNPFFAGEFLKTLNFEKLLTFDTRNYNWHWDLEHIRTKGFTDNVVELVIGNIGKFRQETQLILRYASMLGNVFDLERLSILCDKFNKDIFTLGLNEAIQEGFVVPIDENTFAFSHDRIQQGAYNLIPEGERSFEHLRAGRLLLAHTPKDKQEEHLFGILDQFNKGKELIESEQEKFRIAEFNYRAGQKARESAAFASAYHFFKEGIGFLDENSWKDRYDFTLAIHNNATEAAYISGNPDEMERLGEIILKNARTSLDKTSFYISKIKATTGQGEMAESLSIGLNFLAELGIRIAANPSRHQVLINSTETRSVLEETSPEDIAGFPDTDNPLLQAILSVMLALYTSAHFYSQNTLAVIVYKAIRLLVEKRVASGVSRIFFTLYSAFFGGHEYIRVPDLLANRPDGKESESAIKFLKAYSVLPWKEHLRETLPLLMLAYEDGLKYGNIEYIGYIVMNRLRNMFLAGVEFSEMEGYFEAYVPVLYRLKQERSAIGCLLFRQTILNLRGSSDDPCVISGSIYREEEMTPKHRQGKDFIVLFTLYFLKMFLCYLFGRNAEAVENALTTEECMGKVNVHGNSGPYYFYDSLAHLANMEQMSDEEYRQALKRVAANQKRLRKWAADAPMNYKHKHLLIEAELNRIKGRIVPAMDYYDQAIKLAGENKYLHEEAIANELAGKFYLSLNKARIASTYLDEARYLYDRWGTTAKVEDMEVRYAGLLTKGHTPTKGAGSSSSATERGLDIMSVLKASRVLSGEMVLNSLLSQLLQIAMENAGAERGFLILNDQGRLTIEAQGSIDTKEEPILKSTDINKSNQICAAIVHYVERTKETLVIGNAAVEGQFTNDGYVSREKPRSILCMPIMNQAALTGILYLENNLAVGAFTDKMVEILGILGSQAAISIENARLYSRLQESESNYRGLYENAVEGIFQCTPEGKLLSCNPSLARIMGFNSIEEFLAKAINVFEFYEDKAQRDEMLSELLESGQIIGFETRLARRGRTIIWVAISARTVRDSNGALLHYEGSLIDITAQKEKEIERQAKEAAEAASRSKGDFLARMSHEIRTPLNAILGFSKLLQKDDLTASARQNLEIINRSGEHLLGLINNILELAKIESGRISLKPSVFDIQALMSDIEMLFRERTERKGLNLTLEIHEDTPGYVSADEGKIRQIFINLLGNSIQYVSYLKSKLRKKIGMRTNEEVIMYAFRSGLLSP